jgi:hypothetical protein
MDKYEHISVNKIYIIEQYNDQHGVYGIRGIYNDYKVATTVYNTLTNTGDWGNCNCSIKIVTYGVNVKIIKSVQQDHGHIAYTLIEVTI